jgi:hypothetical protein
MSATLRAKHACATRPQVEASRSSGRSRSLPRSQWCVQAAQPAKRSRRACWRPDARCRGESVRAVDVLEGASWRPAVCGRQLGGCCERLRLRQKRRPPSVATIAGETFAHGQLFGVAAPLLRLNIAPPSCPCDRTSVGGRRRTKADCAARAIDCLDCLERDDLFAFPQPATANDDLVRTVGVTLVAHPIDPPQLAPCCVEHGVSVRGGKQPAQLAQFTRARMAALLHDSRRLRPLPPRMPAEADGPRI